MKPYGNKLRGGGNSPLTKLKARCQREFEKENVSATLDQIMAWAADEKLTNALIRNLIGEFFKVQLARDSQLSSFYSWVKLTRKTSEREGKIQHLLESEKTMHPELTDEQLRAMGQRMFKIVTLADEDPDAWVKILREETRAKQIALDERKIVLLEKKAALADATDKVLSDAELLPEQREQRIREIYGRA